MAKIGEKLWKNDASLIKPIPKNLFKEKINPKFPFRGTGALDLCQVHLLYKMRGARKLVDKEQDIANVNHDVAAN